MFRLELGAVPRLDHGPLVSESGVKSVIANNAGKGHGIGGGIGPVKRGGHKQAGFVFLAHDSGVAVEFGGRTDKGAALEAHGRVQFKAGIDRDIFREPGKDIMGLDYLVPLGFVFA